MSEAVSTAARSWCTSPSSSTSSGSLSPELMAYLGLVPGEYVRATVSAGVKAMAYGLAYSRAGSGGLIASVR
jgi:hypothetical protein